MNARPSDLTPLMKQYWDLKDQVPDAILLFRMGDFYELFGDDAVEAARILEITLTSRDRNKPNPVPMAGVPHHSIQNYLQKLLDSGKKVAIGEQMEDPKAIKNSANKIVRREITRIFSPGIQFETQGAQEHFLGALVSTKTGSAKKWSLACIDASTGVTRLCSGKNFEEIEELLRSASIRHLIGLGEIEEHKDHLSQVASGLLVETLPDNYLGEEQAERALKSHFGLADLSAFVQTPGEVRALGIALTYVLRSQKLENLKHIQLPESFQKKDQLIYGPNTYDHLDLEKVYELINRTKNSLGARLLKSWLKAPLSHCESIKARQEMVQAYTYLSRPTLSDLRKSLSEIYDLERILGRINTQLANPKDTFALGISLRQVKHLIDCLAKSDSSVLALQLKTLKEESDAIESLIQEITQHQKEDAPFLSRDGGIFKKGYHSELDRLIEMTENAQQWLVDLETRERESTGIANLKVRYNRVFGYYIEITQANLKNVPSHYQRKQTMVGAERFFTSELKSFEEESLSASQKRKSLELELFTDLVSRVSAQSKTILKIAQILAQIDVYQTLAGWSQQPGWCFPEITENQDLFLEDCRHPVVEQSMRGNFVPNTLQMREQTERALLITGPNMGGKSTLMRQTALCIILGQMGSPVPAESARWGKVSSIYTRIGAQDAIAKGQSTFMVEMTELAHILHYADERSLILLDEVGRGTSTYDGISVAWASFDWICQKIKARTLFATHYHELVELAENLPRASNAHMAVDDDSNSSPGSNTLRFLYELRSGPTNDSFGIQVAQLAGLPQSVIQKAWQVLAQLEKEETNEQTPKERSQLSLFDTLSKLPEAPPPQAPAKPHPVLQELENLELNDLTPLQALNKLAELHSRLH